MQRRTVLKCAAVLPVVPAIAMMITPARASVSRPTIDADHVCAWVFEGCMADGKTGRLVLIPFKDLKKGMVFVPTRGDIFAQPILFAMEDPTDYDMSDGQNVNGLIVSHLWEVSKEHGEFVYLHIEAFERDAYWEYGEPENGAVHVNWVSRLSPALGHDLNKRIRAQHPWNPGMPEHGRVHLPVLPENASGFLWGDSLNIVLY